LGLYKDTPLVGHFARFDPQKNHFGFIQAAGILHRRLPNLHFVLAGKNIDRSNTAILRAVAKEDISEVMHLLGLRTDLPRLMAALDVFASSSYSEAFPNVVGEAMACGVPCVVTDAGDSAYIVGSAGRVVEPGDATGLATALETLLVMPETDRRKLGKCGRLRVEKHFEIGEVIQRYEKCFDELACQGQN
jgi:glycosyltransferase involved in cell wall biosynthesis